MKSILMDQGLLHLSVINVGISLSEIPAVTWAAGCKTVLMNSGSPIERKGIDHFRRMAKAVQQHRSDAIFQATNYSGDSCITGTRFLNRPALVGLLQKSYMSVLPALWEDPSPLAAIEAMAAGKPVVTYASGGLPEIVDHGVTGLVVPVGDVKALASAVDSLLSDEERAGRMGAAGRQRAESLFSEDRMVQDYRRLLHEVAEMRSGRN
jgi:glycosyltransferase involved in cell wall biosynthesis